MLASGGTFAFSYAGPSGISAGIGASGLVYSGARLQPEDISHGVAPDFLTPENAKAFWSKMKGFSVEQRRSYIAERGGTILIEKDGELIHHKKYRKGPAGVFPWEYGTIFCQSLKLVKQVK